MASHRSETQHPGCLIPGIPAHGSHHASPDVSNFGDDEGSTTVIPSALEVLMSLNSPHVPTKLSNLSLLSARHVPAHGVGLGVTGLAPAARAQTTPIPPAPALPLAKPSDAQDGSAQLAGSPTPRASAVPLKISNPLPGTFQAYKRHSPENGNEDEADELLVQDVRELPPVRSYAASGDTLRLRKVPSASNLSLGKRLIQSYEKMLARLSPSPSPPEFRGSALAPPGVLGPGPAFGQWRAGSLSIEIDPETCPEAALPGLAARPGDGRIAQAPPMGIDELGVEWCLLCGTERPIDEVKLQKVNATVLRPDANGAWGKEQGAEVEGWVCRNACTFGRL